MSSVTAERERLALRDLRTIPGVGKEISRDLLNIGIHAVEELDGADPEDLYTRICRFQGASVDRCMLYVMRCAVYFASTDEPDPALLNWWAWKDARRAGPTKGTSPERKKEGRKHGKHDR